MSHLIANLRSLSSVVRWMMIIQFVFNICSFLVVPFISVYLNKSLGFSVAFVGLQLTIKLFSQRGLMIFGGVLADKFGAPKIMAAGIIVRVISFFLYLFGRDAAVICLSSFAFGFGGALFVPASKAALIRVSDPAMKQLNFSLRSTISNLGMALGCLFGSLLIEADAVFLFLTAAAMQAVCGLLMLHPGIAHLHGQFIERKAAAASGEQISTLQKLRRIFSSREMVIVAILYGIFNLLYAQLEFTLPLATASLFSKKDVGLLFFVNTMTVFFFQVPCNYYLSKNFSLQTNIIIGFGVVALAMTGFYYSSNLWVFLLLVSLYTVGEMVIDPCIDSLSSALVADADLGSLFGIFGMVAMIGGSLGNYIGSHFFVAPSGGPLWLICALSACCACLLMSTQMKRKLAH